MAPVKRRRLQQREVARQFFALARGVELAMAPIGGARACVDEILGDQFLEHPVEALLGDLRMSSSAAMVKPGCRLTKCSTR